MRSLETIADLLDYHHHGKYNSGASSSEEGSTIAQQRRVYVGIVSLLSHVLHLVPSDMVTSHILLLFMFIYLFFTVLIFVWTKILSVWYNFFRGFFFQVFSESFFFILAGVDGGEHLLLRWVVWYFCSFKSSGVTFIIIVIMCIKLGRFLSGFTCGSRKTADCFRKGIVWRESGNQLPTVSCCADPLCPPAKSRDPQNPVPGYTSSPIHAWHLQIYDAGKISGKILNF